MTTHTRPRRAFWGDARFLIGIVLVALSIAGVWLIISSADHTTPVLQANRTIVAGEALVSGDFQVVEVNLGAVGDAYLAPQDLEPGQIAARTLAEGELVPSAAAAGAESGRTTTIVVESSTGIPEDVAPGTVVELWHAPPLEDDRSFDAPRILIADAVVAAIVDTEGMMAGAKAGVEVVIDRSDVADVLAAITGGSVLSLVPVGAGS
ncbi:SAF domain-containing protein [Microbacterium aurantiacum]|uniref:SAF domain-containing protein n=1 Tax=Microbacterium aurantiacum TaxID=162393 RepID=UPI000C808A04|nr:SAF domain-containing protein [Microbacterium aurantiacum]